MENNRTAAYFENREYFYTLKSKSPTEIVISMYSTAYTFIKNKDDKWVNHLNNRNNMVPGLINAVVEAVQP
jgi:hypothetical protein